MCSAGYWTAGIGERMGDSRGLLRLRECPEAGEPVGDRWETDGYPDGYPDGCPDGDRWVSRWENGWEWMDFRMVSQNGGSLCFSDLVMIGGRPMELI
jgi:hypothetical protein